MSEPTASRTAAELSTFASSSSIPSSLQTFRAILVHASEFASDGFQATPTRASFGASRLAMRKRLGDRLHRAHADHVGRMLHRVITRDADAGGDRVAHHPEDMRDLRVAIRRRPRPEGWAVESVMIRSSSPPTSSRAIVVRRGGVALGVEPAQPDRLAVCDSRPRRAPRTRLCPFFHDRAARRAERAQPRRHAVVRGNPNRTIPGRRRWPFIGKKSTTDAATISNTPSDNRRKLLIIQETRHRSDRDEANSDDAAGRPRRSVRPATLENVVVGLLLSRRSTFLLPVRNAQDGQPPPWPPPAKGPRLRVHHIIASVSSSWSLSAEWLARVRREMRKNTARGSRRRSALGVPWLPAALVSLHRVLDTGWPTVPVLLFIVEPHQVVVTAAFAASQHFSIGTYRCASVGASFDHCCRWLPEDF